uniref:Uncharacterized protein n=1 Tax=Eucampia antarctica TaxID=49252 RepID=A0A7S2R227_9STRA|mmetsp:Transcript_14223/g.13729  ORF Transcript_14223/g.13729 Transcript_14223/m.13729 type:complete len:620 (+) Transcript_14223:213-2072(+)|eukprot:CAMPEP_0197824718 /NCGR_PEP_ID=MMETSP1437-20131217/1937_1 /TAXON_ID=49252 ORGANISM="Eucampia antarctica, Strain CCMP1452" /NCGR_SAMPLE_ID=MMETSP1437 /ASSEMBLY_ACC=CAM_ASM_001096 /LENGTH=619 /DNA_ID=CAMNT_0043424461 /DNA_START=187 /DNA_END=2046 /DNA_ORIENTATION=-
MSSERTLEIWSSRLQRELLALTSSDEIDRKQDAGILPPFVTVKDHQLSIEKGICCVTFSISVEGAPKKKEVKTDKETEHQENEENAAGETDGDEPVVVAAPEDTITAIVEITLDASLQMKAGSSPDPAASYPFQRPKAILLRGSEHFPDGSSVQDGDLIAIDCDWTPSLHLNDAAQNIALKVRESIKRGEPFFKLAMETASENLVSSSKVSAFFTSLKTKAAAVVDELDQAAAPKVKSKTKSKPKPKKPPSVVRRKPKKGDRVEIGDIIDLAEEPWSRCAGMYSCKAVRRPEFIEAAIAAAAAEEKNKVAGAGFSGAGSMLKSFTLSAKSLVEESFVMLSEDLILEIKCNRFNVANATVTIAIPVSYLAKLKFRRQESLSLFFKQAPDDPLIYMCPDSADAVKQIQTVLKRHGVKGKHTNASMQRAIQAALQMVAEIQAKEKTLEDNPTVERVNVIMDLYRQAAEKFEIAGDARHEEVMDHMRKFLAKSLTTSILDGSYASKNSVKNGSGTVAPEGEVIEPPAQSVDEVEDRVAAKEKDNAEFSAAMKAAEDILMEAHNDMKDLLKDDEDFDDLLPPPPQKNFDALKVDADPDSSKDAVTELEDMLKDADKELAELMST